MTKSSDLLVLEQVSKSYGEGLTAVDQVSLSIRENEFFALLGPSGCGKTTLMRMIAGFETPTSGAIYLNGQDISPLPPNRRPLNLMFQSYALFPNMTVRGNVAYGLEMEKLPAAEIRQRVDAVLDTAQLGALDKKLREKMQLELKRLQHESGITFIMVTHDQEEALVMSDRMAVLRDGKVCQCGSPSELYENPGSRFVADFIGVSNLIEGRRVGTNRLQAGGQVLSIETTAESSPESVTLALRPERLRVLTDATPATDNQIQGEVAEVAYHGLDTNLHVNTALSSKPLIVRVPSSDYDFLRLAAGMPVRLGWDARHGRVLTH